MLNQQVHLADPAIFDPVTGHLERIAHPVSNCLEQYTYCDMRRSVKAGPSSLPDEALKTLQFISSSSST